MYNCTCILPPGYLFVCLTHVTFRRFTDFNVSVEHHIKLHGKVVSEKNADNI